MCTKYHKFCTSFVCFCILIDYFLKKNPCKLSFIYIQGVVRIASVGCVKILTGNLPNGIFS